jgi:tetratricopeptide (TPR) repeat protein
MTDNHLLLYRLAELMLEHELHILPVDILFDDEQIGDFVKSIQIDSPYQQMLHEGVLTESVRDENLYVSFTVEGYFHYILGRLLHQNNYYQSAQSLIDLIGSNKLLGLKEAIQIVFIIDVTLNNLERVGDFIDACEEKYEMLNLCILAIFQSFTINGIETTLNKVLYHQSNNDWRILMQVILSVVNTKSNNLIYQLAEKLNETFLLNNERAIHITVFLLKYLDIDKAKILCDFLDRIYIDYKYINELDRYSFYNTYASYHSFIGDHKKAITIYNQSLEFIVQSDFFTPHVDALLHNELGLAYYDSGDIENALICHKKSLSLRTEFYPQFPYLSAISLNNVGLSLDRLGKHDEAFEYFIKSTQLKEKVWGKYSLEFAISIHNQGLNYSYRKEYKKAIDILTESYNIKKKHLGSTDSGLAITSNVLGITYFEAKNYKKAKEWLSETLKNRIAAFGKYHYTLEVTFSYLLETCKQIKDFDDALSIARRMLDYHQTVYGSESEKLAISYFELGDINFEMKFFTESINHFNKFLDWCIENKVDHENKGYAFKCVAMANYELEDYSQTILFYNKCLEIELHQTEDLDVFEISELYESIGDAYFLSENYITALQCYVFSAESIKEEIDETDESSWAIVKKCIELADEINSTDKLPAWIKSFKNDV